ncbi:MAG: ATPase, T2SS/T4P/T4SS family [Verrucomicrobiota bacterium]
MKQLLVKSAEECGVEDLEQFQTMIDDAASRQRSLVEDVLNSQSVEEEDFLRSLSGQLGFDYEEELEPKKKRTLKKICSAQLALKFRLLPIAFGNGAEEDEDEEEFGQLPDQLADDDEEIEDGDELAGKNGHVDRLRLATYDPFNLFARQAASQLIKVPVDWCMASRTRILRGIQELYGVGADTFEQILAGRDLDMDSLDVDKDEANVLDAEDDEEASVVKFVNQIIREALDQRATDIHVEPLHDDLRIRYRIDGQLVDIAVPENIRALQSSVIARLKIMSKLDIAERRLPQDGRINLQLEDQGIDVRVATIPTVEGESVSLRLLNQQKFTLTRLGLTEKIRRTIDQLLSMSNGIILITGPTGSGKSTTLYTFLSELNKPETRIVTIEDPVENKLEGVMQIAVKPEIDLTFARGLRSILRGDPNIVMIGEMRDLETAEIAVRASLTGHLVFSTLHTNDSIGGISRLTDMGVEPFLVSASVRAFLAQRLVRRLCNHCKVPAQLDKHSPEYLKSIDFPIDGAVSLFEPGEVGCDKCRGTGFVGRMAIYEIVLITSAMQDLVVQGKSDAEMKQQALRDGYLPMRQYGYQKCLSGDTTVEEVVSATTNELQAVID